MEAPLKIEFPHTDIDIQEGTFVEIWGIRGKWFKTGIKDVSTELLKSCFTISLILMPHPHNPKQTPIISLGVRQFNDDGSLVKSWSINILNVDVEEKLHEIRERQKNDRPINPIDEQ